MMQKAPLRINVNVLFVVSICLILVFSFVLKSGGFGLQKKSVIIQSHLGWQAAGMQFHKGDDVSVNIQGRWTADGRSDGNKIFGWVGAEGNPDLNNWEQCVDGVCAPIMTLIGKVDKTVFVIGANKSFKMPADGELYLAPNDLCCLNDNAGTLDIELIRNSNRPIDRSD